MHSQRRHYLSGSHWSVTVEAQVQSVPVHALFVLDKVAMGWVFPGVLQFSFVSVIPAMPHAFPFISHQCYRNLAVDSTVK